MDSSSIKLFAPFGALIALLVFVVTFAIGVPAIVAAIAGVVLGVTIVVLLFHQSDALVLKGLRVQNADARTQPRVLNVLDGLCDSHGFRKPTVVIVDDPARNACGFGRRAHHSTLALTSGLVDNVDRLQLEGVLARVLGPQVRLALRLEATDAIVQAEAVQLEWVFLSLAANSKDAMPNGGNFLVHTASVDRPVGTPSRMQRFVRVTVTDTGHGLFGDARTRAFDPFFSTKEGAAGLGLTSVAMIVRNYQGWLHIESHRFGTNIHIHLPALRPLTR